MSFGDVLEGYRTLRVRLVTLLGTKALPEITVSTPKDTGTELGFVRLVAWAYALVQENGRIPLRFLLKLGQEALPPVIEDVTVLRTWVAHNLSLGKNSDEKKIKHAWAWFRRSCGVTSPLENEQWQRCGEVLCDQLYAMMRACIDAAEVLDDVTDGPRNLEELKRRLDSDWDAYQFDEFAEAAALRFGYRGLDAPSLRRNKLDSWRGVVRVAAEEERSALLTRRVEQDVLEVMGHALPLGARQILDRLAGASTAELATVMLVLRRRAPVDQHELGVVLAELWAAVAAAPHSHESEARDG